MAIAKDAQEATRATMKVENFMVERSRYMGKNMARVSRKKLQLVSEESTRYFLGFLYTFEARNASENTVRKLEHERK